MNEDTELLAWLAEKIVAAEQTVRAREQSETVLRSGDDKSWAIAAKMHPSTADKPFNKAARLQAAEGEKRILVKCRHDLAMFKTVAVVVSKRK